MSISSIQKVLSLVALSFTILLCSSAQAQLPHVAGEILMQPRQGLSVEEAIATGLQIRGVDVTLSVKEQVSAPMDIYKLAFSPGPIHELEVLRAVKAMPGVAVAQFNHYVASRNTLPDDILIPNQWQYVNTGQSGGTVDADIDADQAWDITTGGMTATGDEIVVCIIDDGINEEHDDIAPNLWTNTAEIAGNNIDDDGNGFIDDVRGWDTGSNSDAVYDGGGHGTPVAGIVGAKGNNGLGVTGVNWDVKLMIVQGGTGVESEVLEAYSYPLVMRQMYNESNGEEGAFVVSTNASWGINGGQPSDAPLWCAFYDELGEAGIISCGATINGNQNVDTFGDLPTACPSDYLISVTNTNRNDNKVTQAGYGATTIDLGAPGEDALTVTSTGGYGGFGGTSGATPHVAGTVALLYSAPCSGLMSLAYSDPAAGATAVIDAIYAGVDPNESLEGITTTGGRLNMFNSLNELMETCGPCPAPYGLEVQNLTDTQGALAWEETDSTLTTTLEWRMLGAVDWTIVADASSPYMIDVLSPCTDYEFRVIGTCAEEDSEYSNTYSFQTDGCCENPELFELGAISNNSVEVSWESVLAAEQYTVQYRVAGAADWTSSTVTDLNVTLEGLLECTDYEVQIQVVCTDGPIGFSESLEFRTTGCGACTDNDYCTLDEVSTDDEWIAEVVIDAWSHSSDASDNGYQDHTLVADELILTQGGVYGIELTPAYAGFQYNEYFKVYIDLDQDGDFTENEVVYDAGAAAVGPSVGELLVPVDASLGLTRMRVIMQFNAAASGCAFSGNFGEAEDYCVLIDMFDSVDEIQGLDNWSVAPNPSAGELTLSIANPTEVLTVTLMDMQGRALESRVLSTSDAQRSTWDLSGIDAGVYLMQLSNQSGQAQVKRVIKN